jgi:hypothetical protein
MYFKYWFWWVEGVQGIYPPPPPVFEGNKIMKKRERRKYTK